MVRREDIEKIALLAALAAGGYYAYKQLTKPKPKPPEEVPEVEAPPVFKPPSGKTKSELIEECVAQGGELMPVECSTYPETYEQTLWSQVDIDGNVWYCCKPKPAPPSQQPEPVERPETNERARILDECRDLGGDSLYVYKCEDIGYTTVKYYPEIGMWCCKPVPPSPPEVPAPERKTVEQAAAECYERGGDHFTLEAVVDPEAEILYKETIDSQTWVCWRK